MIEDFLASDNVKLGSYLQKYRKNLLYASLESTNRILKTEAAGKSRLHGVTAQKTVIYIVATVRSLYPEIKCQLDATDELYCRSYCSLNTFRAPLCPSSGAREYYTSGCCLSYLVLWFSSCCSNPQTGHITLSSTPYRKLENQNTKYERQQPLV